MEKIYIIIVAVCCGVNSLKAETANELLGKLNEKTSQANAEYNSVKQALVSLETTYPTSDQTALGEALFASYLVDQEGGDKIVEMESILNKLRAKGESKLYTLWATVSLGSAYSAQMNAENKQKEKELAASALMRVVANDAKQSFRDLLEIMKVVSGEGLTNSDDVIVDEWITALNEMKNTP